MICHCHDLTMLSVNVSDIDIITIKNVDYRCIIHNIIIYKMVDSEYSMGIYRSIKINIRTAMKNPEMSTFVPDHLKTKKCESMQLKITFSNDICS